MKNLFDTTPEIVEPPFTEQAGKIAGYAAIIALTGVATVKTTRFVRDKLVARKERKDVPTETTN